MALIPKIPAPLEVVVGLVTIGAGIGAAVGFGPDDAKNLVDALKTAGSFIEYVAASKYALPFITYVASALIGVGGVKEGIRQMRNPTNYQDGWV